LSRLLIVDRGDIGSTLTAATTRQAQSVAPFLRSDERLAARDAVLPSKMFGAAIITRRTSRLRQHGLKQSTPKTTDRVSSFKKIRPTSGFAPNRHAQKSAPD